jgi:multidrug efflux pump subunit AcrB
VEAIVRWWVNNPVAANLLMLGILLSGFLGFQATEREAFPQFNPKQVQITVPWPGAAPQEVEEQIVKRIEEALDDVGQIDKVTATATEGMAFLQISTFPKTEINGFVDDIKNAVDSIPSFPRDIENPRVGRLEYRGQMMRVMVYGNLEERELYRLAEDLRDEVSTLPWVSTINLMGTRKEEVSIELSEQAMRRYGVNFTQVAAAIRANSLNLSSGEVRTQTGDVQLRARNLADTQTDFEDIVVRQSSAGAVVRVGDVARVIDGYEDDRVLTSVDGQPAVMLDIQNTEVMQVVKASAAVHAWMEKRSPSLPPGVGLTVWFDTSDIYESRMDIISSSAYMGLVLVFLVLILSLRPRVALWVTAGIGVAFVGSFALLPSNDVSLNVMSTFAFLLVLGIVVDDAIVIGESIHHHTHTLGGGAEGAVAGTLAVSRPVIFAVLTTMIAFAPWFFVSGDRAQMTRQISLVITLALSISLIEAFFILPSHLRHLKPRKQLHGLARQQQRLEHSIISFAENQFRPVLAWAVAHRYLTTSLFAGAFVIAVGLFSAGWVKFYFFPKVESPQVVTRVVMPTGTPFSRALEVQEQLHEAELALIEQLADQRRGTSEEGTPFIDGWYTRTSRTVVNASIKLAPAQLRNISSEEVANRYRALLGDIPDADEIEVNFTLHGNSADASWQLRHRDGDVLRQASRDMQEKLRSYDGTFYVRDSQRGESDEIIMHLKPGAEKLGITLAEVSLQVRQAYYGEEVQRLPREFGDVKVMVRYPLAARSSLSSLDEFRVRTVAGHEVPLLSVVDVEIASGVARIQRRDGERVLNIKADMDNAVMGDILADINNNFIPELTERYPDLLISEGGQQEQQAEFFSELVSLYAVAFFVMYALIAIAFHSYWLPLLIMTAIPFGFMGAVFGHVTLGVAMDMFSWFGIGAAAGVVVNDNLVLVDYIGRLRERGGDKAQSIIDAGTARFRPILLTTVTTFIGLTPILLESSTSAQFLKPSVVSLSFGVLFALSVTLLMVPALYAIGDDCSKALSRLKLRA